MSADQSRSGPPPDKADAADPDATALDLRPAQPPPANADLGATIAIPNQADADLGATIAFRTNPAVDPGATIAFTPRQPPPPGAPPPGGAATGARSGATAPPPNPKLANRARELAPAWTMGAPQRKRSRLPWLLTFLLLAAAGAVAAYLLLHRSSDTTPAPALQVVGVSVTSPATASCDSTVTVSAAITTNGKQGTITYQWKRSDGQTVAAQQLAATANQSTYAVSLLWTVAGNGRFDAVATLTIRDPAGTAPASAHFIYSC